MRRQSLVIFHAKNLNRYNIPQLLFDENKLIIVWDEFLQEMIRYIHTKNIFMIPRWLFDKHKHDIYEIDENYIRLGQNIISNIDATYNGEFFFPDSLINNKQDYGEFEGFGNLKDRLDRLSDFGHPTLAARLEKYILRHKYKLEQHRSDSHHIFWMKLNGRVALKTADQYDSIVDDITWGLFTGNIDSNQLQYYQNINSYKETFIIYGILNHILSKQIYSLTNRNDKYFKALVQKLDD